MTKSWQLRLYGLGCSVLQDQNVVNKTATQRIVDIPLVNSEPSMMETASRVGNMTTWHQSLTSVEVSNQTRLWLLLNS